MEPIGSWIGRVDACYRTSVGELAHLYDLELAFDRLSNTWLQVSPIDDVTFEKLAALARGNVAYIGSIEHGVQNPGMVSIIQIAAAMEMTVIELAAEARL